MTWLKLDDGFESHPKVLALKPGREGDAALALWVKAFSWVGRHLTDGFVPDSYLAKSKRWHAAGELVRVRLWVKVTGGYQFHNFAKHNPQKAEVLARREKEAEKKRKMRAAKRSANDNGSAPADKRPPACPPGTAPMSPGDSPGTGSDLSTSIPSRPGPSHTQKRINQTRPRAVDPSVRPVVAAALAAIPATARARAVVGNGSSAHADFADAPATGDPMAKAYALIRSLQPTLPNIASHDVTSWADDWMWLATRPAAELAKVVQTLQRSSWATRSWQLCTPRHIRKFWAAYAAGKEPRGPDGGGTPPANGRGPVPARDDFSELAKQTPKWLTESESDGE